MIAPVLALGAGLGYAIATVLQQRAAANAAPELALRPALVMALLRRPIWLLGLAVDVVAFGLEAGALATGLVVQVAPLLVTGLLFALPLSTIGTTRRMTTREWRSALAVTAGLAAFLVISSPRGGSSNALPLAWALSGCALLVMVGSCIGAARCAPAARRAFLFGIATGCVYALTAVLTKATVVQLTHHTLGTVGDWQPYALLLASGVALVLNQSAFQAGDVAASLPAISVVRPVLAGLLGIAVLGEHLTIGSVTAGGALVVAIVAMIGGTVSLSRSPLVQHL